MAGTCIGQIRMHHPIYYDHHLSKYDTGREKPSWHNVRCSDHPDRPSGCQWVNTGWLAPNKRYRSLRRTACPVRQTSLQLCRDVAASAFARA